MHSSILFEFQKDFSIFNPNLDSSGNQISSQPDVYDKNRFNIVLNGNTLVENVDYKVNFANAEVFVIREFVPNLTTSSLIQFILYSNSSKTTIVNSISSSINPLGGSLTLDKVNIGKCETVNVNSNLESRAYIGFTKNSASAAVKIKSGSNLLAFVTASDFDKQSILEVGPTSNMTFTNGVLTNNYSAPSIMEAVTTPRIVTSSNNFIIETSMDTLSGRGIDTFRIDGVGFARIEHPGSTYALVNPLGEETLITKSDLPLGAIFKVEVTSSEYILTVNGVEKIRYTRTSTYNSPVGNFTSSSIATPVSPIVVPYGTPVVFHPTSGGNSYVQVLFSAGIGLIRSIINNFPEIPYFGVSNTFTNTCPDNQFNLYTLEDQNSKSGFELEWHSVANPTSNSTKLSNLYVGPGTYYAVQKQTGVSCYGVTRMITVTQTSCCTSLTTANFTLPAETIINQTFTTQAQGLDGDAPYTYLWTVTNGVIIGSNVSNIVSITPTGHPINVNLLVNNCGGVGNYTLSKSTNVKVECNKVVAIDISCSLTSVTNAIVNLQGVSESNRVVSFTNNELIFKTKVGQHNYSVTLMGEGTEKPVYITLKNIVCS